MSQPPYHLRQNKTVDRLLFIDAIHRLRRRGDLNAYTYYSLGGPYLDDFRLVYESFPEMKMVSIESDEEIYKRQQFHLPCGNLTLQNADLRSFIAGYTADDAKSIFWLDNTGFKYAHFETFTALLPKVSAGSMLKITLDTSAERVFGMKGTVQERAVAFREQYGAVLPDSEFVMPMGNYECALLIQRMLRIAAEHAMPTGAQMTFQPISSFFYRDGAAMLTVTGIVCFRSELADVRKMFAQWPFANLDWSGPKKIDLPVLSTKERLHLQKYLPCIQDSGRTLRNALGYLTVEDNEKRTEEQLAQYAEYHRYSPYFIRAVP
jgi:hypothetical protein